MRQTEESIFISQMILNSEESYGEMLVVTHWTEVLY